MQYLAVNQSNLLHARRTAREHGWWSQVASVMSGLRVLYECQGRRAEWSRLLTEVVSDFCTMDDQPVPGREDDYPVIMSYRIAVALNYEHDLDEAGVLAAKLVDHTRLQTSSAVAALPEAQLDERQRNSIRNLGVALEQLARILQEQAGEDCVKAYEEAIQQYQRIHERAGEAGAHLNIGIAYMTIPAIRDLEAAQGAFELALSLHDENDGLGRARCIHQIGAAYHHHFSDSRPDTVPMETRVHYAHTAQAYYHRALKVCPETAKTVLGRTHCRVEHAVRGTRQYRKRPPALSRRPSDL